MHQSPSAIMESVKQAKAMMATLQDRASRTGSIDDRAELSVLQTTVRRLEELMRIAAEYDDVLMRQLARTSTRINMASN